VIDWAFDVFHWMEGIITDVSQSPWFFLLVFSIAFFDSVIPIVPSEFTVIAGGVASGAGTLIDDHPVLSLFLVIVCGASGAYGGDSFAYWIGRNSEKTLRRWFFRGERGEERLVATGAQIRKRGGLLLITARFIPGGRTAMTFSCGLTHQPFLAWFTRWDLLATTLWASYAGALGYFVGDAVENQSTALWLAFGIALSVTVVIEAIRWLRERFRSDEPEPGRA
jgi:membrane protein DedA with SNARE-associated domain